MIKCVDITYCNVITKHWSNVGKYLKHSIWFKIQYNYFVSLFGFEVVFSPHAKTEDTFQDFYRLVYPLYQVY